MRFVIETTTAQDAVIRPVVIRRRRRTSGGDLSAADVRDEIEQGLSAALPDILAAIVVDDAAADADAAREAINAATRDDLDALRAVFEPAQE